jgi:hypothetical protein
MMSVTTFFKRWLRLPLSMESGDWPVYEANPPEPYGDLLRRSEEPLLAGTTVFEAAVLRWTDLLPSCPSGSVQKARVNPG